MTVQKIKPYHVAIAAEAFAAGVFARLGYDISIQYGANQPDYDLIVKKSKENKFLSISVKGSQDGGWGLLQKYKKGRTNQQAIEEWLKNQNINTVYCFVQFKNKSLAECPSIYLAKPNQIAEHLLKARGNKGALALAENIIYKKGELKGQKFAIPESWKFSANLIETFFI